MEGDWKGEHGHRLWGTWMQTLVNSERVALVHAKVT